MSLIINKTLTVLKPRHPFTVIATQSVAKGKQSRGNRRDLDLGF